MKLDGAINLLETEVAVAKIFDRTLSIKALNLGIEALKLVRELRLHHNVLADYSLPGETKETWKEKTNMAITVREEATNYKKWQEYVDPTSEWSEKQFDAATTTEKMRLIVATWPDQINESDTEALLMLEEANHDIS